MLPELDRIGVKFDVLIEWMQAIHHEIVVIRRLQEKRGV